MGSLVNVQERAHTMSSPMTEIQSIRPQSSPGEDIEHVTCRPSGKDGRVNGDMSLQDPREASFLVFGRLLEMERSCDICGAVQVLRARIT